MSQSDTENAHHHASESKKLTKTGTEAQIQQAQAHALLVDYLYVGSLVYEKWYVVHVYLCPACHSLVPDGSTDHHDDWHKNLETI